MLQGALHRAGVLRPEARGAKVKSPVRLLVGACRDLRLEGEATPSSGPIDRSDGTGTVQPADRQGLAVGRLLDQRQHPGPALSAGRSLVEGKTAAQAEPLGPTAPDGGVPRSGPGCRRPSSACRPSTASASSSRAGGLEAPLQRRPALPEGAPEDPEAVGRRPAAPAGGYQGVGRATRDAWWKPAGPSRRPNGRPWRRG